MAVVQISRIQIRRGKKNSEPGVPQLSSAEFAWAVDTQELFIGNGSVAEGAPYVGNTKILTEHDNLLELIGPTYRFKSTDPAITLSEYRSIQDKLDDIVNLVDFIVETELGVDWNTTFDNAISQLFNNSSTSLRKTLIIPNNEYVFTRKLTLPSGVRLQGENPNETIINLADQIIEFNRDNLDDRSFDVHFSNLTFRKTTGGIDLALLADSQFENVIFEGNYAYPANTLIPADSGFLYWSEINAFSSDQSTILFDRCTFKSIQEIFKFEQAELFTTILKFRNCKFKEIHTGFKVAAVSTQYPEFEFSDCQFFRFYNRVFLDNVGINTLFYRSSFAECGNSSNQPAFPIVPIIEFSTRSNNRVLDCSFDRPKAITVATSNATITEVLNASKVTLIDQIEAIISNTVEYRYLTNLSLDNRYYKIEYRINLGTAIRVGTLTLAINQAKTSVEVTDDYNFSPSSSSVVMDDFEFDAVISGNTILLNYINPTAGAAGQINFNITYGV